MKNNLATIWPLPLLLVALAVAFLVSHTKITMDDTAQPVHRATNSAVPPAPPQTASTNESQSIEKESELTFAPHSDSNEHFLFLTAPTNRETYVFNFHGRTMLTVVFNHGTGETWWTADQTNWYTNK